MIKVIDFVTLPTYISRMKTFKPLTGKEVLTMFIASVAVVLIVLIVNLYT